MMDFLNTPINTPRLTLRKLQTTDAADIFAVYGDPEVMRYWSRSPYANISEAEEMITHNIKWWEAGRGMCIGIEHKQDQKLIGTCSLFSFEKESRRAEIGYILNQAYWRRGLASEAVSAVIDYAFTHLNLNRIEADIDPANIGSRKTLEKTAFKLEGLLRQRWIVDGNVTDSEMFGLLRQEWEANKRQD